MKHTLLTALCLIGTFAGRAQYFNQRYPLHSYDQAHIYNAVERPGGYLAIGSGSDASTGTPTLDVLLLDASGNVIRDTAFTDTADIDGNYYHPIFNNGDGTFTIIYQLYSGSSRYIGRMHVNSMGDIISRQLSPSFPNSGTVDVKRFGSNWLTMSTTGTSIPGSFTKRDSAMNIVWDLPLPVPATGLRCGGSSICQAVNSYFFIENIYSDTSVFSPSYFEYSRIIQTDTMGNVIWSYDTPHDKFIGGICMTLTADEGIVYCGYRNTPVLYSPSFQIPYSKGWIQKLDKDGNIAWTDSTGFGTPYNDGNMFIVKELPDHSLIAAGNVKKAFDESDADTTYRGYPFLIKYSSDGAVMWRRKYRYQDDIYEAHPQVFDLQLTSDGGFLLAVDADQSPYSTSGYQGWLIKVDSNGYAEPGHELVNAPENDEDKIVVYPNPTTGQISIDEADHQLLRITDATGRELRTEMISGTHTQLNLGTMARGNYFLRFYNTFTGGVIVKKEIVGENCGD